MRTGSPPTGATRGPSAIAELLANVAKTIGKDAIGDSISHVIRY